MGIGVVIDFVLGVGTLLVVPYHRKSAITPSHGAAIYLGHAVLGFLLTLAGVVIIPRARRMPRPAWLGAVTGLVGLAIAGAGGVLSTIQPARLAGMGLMMLGSIAAVAGYLMPLLDSVPPPES
jgi:hypothetical protein